jgi:TonB family protein
MRHHNEIEVCWQRGKGMNQAILLLDYEPRTAVRVTEALAPLGCQIVTARDVDTAVAACAKAEPQVVLTTSVLPRLKVEDAIMQLRARAGLRHTPFLVLMSGYTGQDPIGDAHKLGAQDIVAKPFSAEELLAHVRALITRRPEAHVSADTRAEVLEALKRAGASKDAGTVTSKDLFGELLAEEPAPAQTQRIQIPSPPGSPDRPVPEPPPGKGMLADADAVVEQALASAFAEVHKAPPKVRKDSGEVSVDKLLEDTLSGLDISKTKSARPAPAPPEASAEGAPKVAESRVPVSRPEAGVSLPEAAPRHEGPPKPTSAPGVAAPEIERIPGPLPSGTPFGQYELIEPIATGGMAEVYRARMSGVEGFQKIVAIKRILPHLTDNHEFVTMFVDEAKLAAQLQHPNIVHIYDLGKIERSYYIAMEYIDGRDLRSILRTLEERHARLPLGLALFIASRLAAALDYAHHKRDLQGTAMALVHRDVSPQNVLISYDGDIKLCDFGIAKAASKASHTRAGALKGKLQYMSPEQAWGRDIDGRSDIFAVGLVLYEMLTGRKGFAGDSELSILEQVRSPHLIPPREFDPAIPPEVERAVMKALKENREERYQTAAEFAADLGNMLQAIRPTPGAAELGAFLAELVGHERQASATPVPTPRPAVTPPPRPAPPAPTVQPAKPKPIPHPSAAEHVHVEAPPVFTTPRQSSAGLIAGIAVVVLAAAAGIFYIAKSRSAPGASAEATPAPETVEMAREVAQQEVDKQTQALRERLSNEILGPTPVPAGRPPAAPPPARAAAVIPKAIETPIAVQPTVTPTVAVQEPSPAPAAVEPTEAPPTPLPGPATAALAPAALPPAPEQPVVQQPTVREGDLVELGGDVVPPEPVYKAALSYPPLAARQRVEGTVLLDVLIDENGSVQDVKVLRGVKPDLGLDAAAASAARRWRYRPATKGGVRVKVRITQAITFTLKPPD